MQSKATTVKGYLAELPKERRAAIEAVRAVIVKNLDSDYEEGMQYGMIGYYVPHRLYPAGYHCDPSQPLLFVALASQKNYMSLYLMPLCVGASRKWFQEAWAKSGKKLNMGKSCVRFKKLEDLALGVIAGAINRVPAKQYVAFCESLLKTKDRPAKRKPKTRKPAKATKTRK